MENLVTYPSQQNSHNQSVSAASAQLGEFGDLHFNQGEYQQSITYYEKALKVESANETQDVLCLASLNDKLGSAYSKMRMWTEAINAYQKSIDITMNLHSKMSMSNSNEPKNFEELVSRLIKTSNLAGEIRKEQGFYNGAESDYRRIVGLYGMGNLEKDERLALACINLGFMQIKKDIFDEALVHFEEAQNIYTYTFNRSEDADIANIYEGQGIVAMNQENYEECLYYLNRALEIRVKVLGSEDLSVARIYDIYTRYYLNRSEIKKAQECCNLSLEIKQKKECKPTDLAQTYCGLGLICKEESKFEEAENYFKMAMKLYTQEELQEHPEMIEFYNNLAFVRLKQKKFDEAFYYLGEAQTVSSNREWTEFPKHHHLIADIYEVRGQVYTAQKRFMDSFISLKQSDEIRTNIFGKMHLSIAQLHQQVGFLYFLMSKFKEAIESYEYSLSIKNHKLGTDHISLAVDFSLLGMAYNGLGDPDNSVHYLERSVALLEKYYGKEHLETLKPKMNLCIGYSKLKNYKSTIVNLKELLKIYTQVLGVYGLKTIKIANMLAINYYSIGNKKEAIKLLKACYIINKKSQSKNHLEALVIPEGLSNINMKSDEYDTNSNDFLL